MRSGGGAYSPLVEAGACACDEMLRPLIETNAAMAAKSAFGIFYAMQEAGQTNSSGSKVRSDDDCQWFLGNRTIRYTA